MSAKSAVRNTTWAELKVGDTASIERTCSVQDLILFAHVSGNLNPLMLPRRKAGAAKGEPVAPSMWVGSLVSAVLGNILPGPGTLYRAQDLHFLRPRPCRRQGHSHRRSAARSARSRSPYSTPGSSTPREIVCEGTAEIEAPTVTQVTETRDLPQLIVDSVDHFGALVAKAARLPPLKTAIVCPDDHNSLGGALLSAKGGLIGPILIGDPERIRAAAKALEVDLSGFPIEFDRRPASGGRPRRRHGARRQSRRRHEGQPSFGHPACRGGQEGRRPAHRKGGSAMSSRSTSRHSTRSSTSPTLRSISRPI